ncbi:MAG: homogentisate 1,2-dioxygenase [Acidimicrobiia bacterium]
MTIEYMSGFGNEHASEAVAGALPVGQNNPQKPPRGLYTEQLSGTAFTAPKAENRRTWFYRMRPSVLHVHDLRPVEHPHLRTAPNRETEPPIGQLRWDPIPMESGPLTWLDGLRTIATNGDVHGQYGMAAHIYLATKSMDRTYFYNADGELLIVPQEGGLRIATECGVIEAVPGEVCLIPRAMKFKVDLMGDHARGYVCENYGTYLDLPERGPIGANGLANARDFLAPTAAYEETEGAATVFVKFDGRLFASDIEHSPLDVVAWHGNHVPYKYDLAHFNTMGSISFDHPDPSIFTVLTSQSDRPGTANLDFVIFPDRWLVAEHTFRPPYYHSNIMSEFMGLIHGVYDAKLEGFNPGGFSLHNQYWPHGPDNEAFEGATNATLEPQKLEGTLAFMFETRYPLIPTAYASTLPALQEDYQEVWASLRRRFGR